MTTWLSDVLAQLSALARLELAGAFVCYAVSLALRATAWRNMLAATARAPVAWSDAGVAFFAGAGVNAVVPARLGVGIRVALAHFHVRRLGWAEIAGTLGVEAVFNSLAGIAFTAWGVTLLVRSNVSAAPSPRLAFLALLVAVIGTGLLILVRRSAQDRVQGAVSALGKSFSLLGRPRLYLRRVAVWQAADWLARLGAIALVLRAADLDHRLETILLVQAALCLATLLPLTPAGIGAKQGALVLVLAGTASSASLVAFGIALALVHALVDITLGLAALAVIVRRAGSPVDALSFLRRSLPRPALRSR